MITIKQLSLTDDKEYFDLLQSIPKNENGFENGACGLTYEEFQAWLEKQVAMSNGENLQDWMVPQTIFWFLADGEPVGFGKIRHRLTDALRKAGGNIGYSIAPVYRGRGYAAQFVALLVDEMKARGMDEILFTIHADNAASIKVAEKCGAKKIQEVDGRVYLQI